MKKRILSILLTLVMVIGMLPTVAFAETSTVYITKIEINDFNPEFHTGMTGTAATESLTFSYPVDANYTKGYNNKYIEQNGSFIYDDNLTAGAATLRIDAYALPLGANEDNPAYDFDEANLGSIEVWINGEKREDVEVKDYNSAWRSVDLYIPVTVSEYTGLTHTVTFDSNGGSAVASQQVADNGYASKPVSKPTKDGKIFAGWYTDAGLTTEFNFYSTPITSDITLYAKWEDIVTQYITKIEINDFNPEFHTGMTGNAATGSLSFTYPADANYTKGYNNKYIEQNGSKIYGNYLTAGAATLIIDAYAMPLGSSVENPAYDFDEANLDSIEVWINGEKREDVEVKDYNSAWRSVDLYIPVTVSELPPYTVTVVNGICTATGESTARFYSADTVEISANVLEGQTFTGWTSNDIVLNYSGQQTTTFSMPAKDVTITAGISGAADIEAVAASSNLTTPISGETVTTPSFTVTEGMPVYIQNGKWQKYDDASSDWSDYSGTTFEEGKYRYAIQLRITLQDQVNYLMSNDVAVTVDGVSWEVANKITNGDSDKLTTCWAYSSEYTAIPAPPEYRIVIWHYNGDAGRYTFQVYSGTGFCYADQGYYEAGTKIRVTAYPYEGYQFEAWKDDNTGEVVSTAAAYEFILNSDTELFPAFKPKTLASIAITTPPDTTTYVEGDSFDPDGMVVTATYSDGSTAEVTDYTISPNGALSGNDTYITVSYTLNGVTKTATQAITVSTPPVYSEYTVSFAANGGTGTMADVTGISGEYTLPENGFTAPEGKQFKGWAISPDGAVIDSATIDVTADITLYAKWTESPAITRVDIASIKVPAVGATPVNGATVSTADVYVGENTFWVRYDSETGFTDQYEDGESVSSVPFRAGESYLLQIMLEGDFDPAVKVYYKGSELPAPDLSNPNQSFAMYVGEGQVVAYIATGVLAETGTYTVSFVANGGTGTMADVTGISGEYTLPANGFTAPDGKQFKAWSVGGVEKAVGSTINVTANTTVTAIWEAIEYNVTVTGGTASVGAGTPITKATMGTTVTLTAGAAPTGQMFDKWVVKGVVVDDATSATTTFTMPAGAVSVKATYKDKPTTPDAIGLLGDANCDGKVNIKDATLIQKSIANLTTLTETGEALADADLNTKINIKDATAIQKHIAGIETGFPIGEPLVSKENN